LLNSLDEILCFNLFVWRKEMNKKLIIVCLGAVAFLLPSLAGATVSGPCVDCHTMHNSQDGADVNAAANDQLLNGAGCVGCHAMPATTNGATGVGTLGAITAPQVHDATNPNAGGYFTMTDVDNQQHNVSDISIMTADGSLLGGAPGNNGGTDYSAALTGDSPTLGCGSCHSNAVHHNVATGTFRGLSPLTFTATQEEHAEYGNRAQSLSAFAGIGATGDITYDATGMNDVCGSCHADFHTLQASGTAGMWIRHPTDVSLSAEIGAGNAPSVVVITTATDNDAVTLGVDPLFPALLDEVMCISCHASHGSPYPDLLKYDYDNNVAGGTIEGSGCETCHSYLTNGM
jgi:hypothetical protein